MILLVSAQENIHIQGRRIAGYSEKLGNAGKSGKYWELGKTRNSITLKDRHETDMSTWTKVESQA